MPLFFCIFSLFVFLGFVTLGGVAMDLGIPKRRKQDSEKVFISFFRSVVHFSLGASPTVPDRQSLIDQNFCVIFFGEI